MTNLEAVKSSTNCIDLIGQTVQLRRVAGNKEYAGACPKCGGHDRLRVQRDGWFCRQCHDIDVEHGWHSAADWIMFTQGVDLQAAIRILDPAGVQAAKVRYAPAHTVQAREQQPKSWRETAGSIVEEEWAALLEGENAGAAYFEARGILPATYVTFMCGWAPKHPDGPAVSFPWFSKDGVVGIRYRFLAPADGEPKIKSKPGSRFGGVLFGSQGLLRHDEHRRRLVIVEGEMNALSIWQAAHEWGVDVLSLGSESQKLTPAVAKWAGRFSAVYAWLDKQDKVEPLVAQLRAGGCSNVIGFASPRVDSREWDANDILRAGHLGGVLANLMLKGCRNRDQTSGLLWDLRHASMGMWGLDKDTAAFGSALAAKLGAEWPVVECEDGAWRTPRYGDDKATG